MAKKIDGYIKLQVPAGKANPSPPIGPALGQKGVNIMAFCKEFNAATASMEPGLPIPTEITVYADKSFTFDELKDLSQIDKDTNKEEDLQVDNVDNQNRFSLTEFRVVGSILNTYIVLEKNNSMYLLFDADTYMREIKNIL